MKFPFWYIGEKVFYKPDNFDLQTYTNRLLLSEHISQESNNYITYRGQLGFLHMPAKIRLKLSDDGVTIQAKYFLSLFESNIIFLLGVAFSTFFFIMDKKEFAGIAIGLGLLYYILNVVHLSNFVKQIIRDFGSVADSVEQQKLWLNQQDWTKDPAVCSACGEAINTYAVKCVNCGMHYKDKKTTKAKPISNINFS